MLLHLGCLYYSLLLYIATYTVPKQEDPGFVILTTDDFIIVYVLLGLPTNNHAVLSYN